eukprot:NODE_875_length_1117_cov_145.582397_g713_i0.p1 GENE.NODE_875_length_1117_cov_145.582397_g713_i0~~NODE_875_length_1117_cov_145.582397_g713_i0.p1  ORF type:complete len:343 (-),score=106.77 NODE_875_length_1117_cov_145.582397_g713_i0:88-1089(-)
MGGSKKVSFAEGAKPAEQVEVGVDRTGLVLVQLHAASAGLKAFCTDWACEGMEAVRKTCGGQGYTMSGGIGSLILDFMPAVTYEGEKNVMALQTSRFLYRCAKSQRPLEGPVGYLQGAKEEVACPVDDPKDFRDLSNLVTIFQQRASWAVLRATKGVDGQLAANGNDFTKAWIANHLPLIRAAEAHCLLLVLTAFEGTVLRFPDQKAQRVLHRLCAFFALHRIRSIAVGDWPDGYFSAQQLSSIDATLDSLAAELRPDAVALVDAFGYTDRDLRGSCIGRNDGRVYESLFEWAKRSPLNEPSYVQSVWKEYLEAGLDKTYLSRKMQREMASKI